MHYKIYAYLVIAKIFFYIIFALENSGFPITQSIE